MGDFSVPKPKNWPVRHRLILPGSLARLKSPSKRTVGPNDVMQRAPNFATQIVD